jgi:hypothetical protein
VGLLNPLNLLFGLSLAVLIAIYLRAQARPTLEVSSLMLFEEAPAPVARSRLLRLDLLFWLQAATLVALTLAAAGFYVRTAAPPNRLRQRALIFDLGVSMDARDPQNPRAGSRLQGAQRMARTLVDDAAAGSQIEVIGYALEARTAHVLTSRKADVDRTVDALRATAVAARPSALRAAINRANADEKIDLFTDRQPDPELLKEARTRAPVVVHLVGTPVDNLALVALEPGAPKSNQGRCVVRNFAYGPRICELTIDLDGQQVFDSPLMLEPRAVVAVRFGPLTQGGVLHAHLSPVDGLAADNDRYASAPRSRVARALVVSPDSSVRDDLARVLLAVNPSSQVTAIDSAPAALKQQSNRSFDLVVLHDTDAPGITGAARLFVFPPTGEGGTAEASYQVIGSVAAATLESRASSGPLATPVALGAARLVVLPGWMDALAQGADRALTTPFPLAAAGYTSHDAVGVITFDVRNHLLLDSDRLDALLLVVDTIKLLGTSATTRVVNTGESVTLPTFAATTLVAPDGARTSLVPDRWGRVRFKPLLAGRYQLLTKAKIGEVYANYYDESGSDLAGGIASQAPAVEEARAPAAALAETHVAPLSGLLVGIVLLLLCLESALLARRAYQRAAYHV